MHWRTYRKPTATAIETRRVSFAEQGLVTTGSVAVLSASVPVTASRGLYQWTSIPPRSGDAIFGPPLRTAGYANRHDASVGNRNGRRAGV